MERLLMLDKGFIDLLNSWSMVSNINRDNAGFAGNIFGNALVNVPKGVDPDIVARHLHHHLENYLHFRFCGMKPVIRHTLAYNGAQDEMRELIVLGDKIQDAGRWSDRFAGILQLNLNPGILQFPQMLDKVLALLHAVEADVITLFTVSGMRDEEFQKLSQMISRVMRLYSFQLSLYTVEILGKHIAQRMKQANISIQKSAKAYLTEHLMRRREKLQYDDYDYLAKLLDALCLSGALNPKKAVEVGMVISLTEKTEAEDERFSSRQIGFTSERRNAL